MHQLSPKCSSCPQITQYFLPRCRGSTSCSEHSAVCTAAPQGFLPKRSCCPCWGKSGLPAQTFLLYLLTYLRASLELFPAEVNQGFPPKPFSCPEVPLGLPTQNPQFCLLRHVLNLPESICCPNMCTEILCGLLVSCNFLQVFHQNEHFASALIFHLQIQRYSLDYLNMRDFFRLHAWHNCNRNNSSLLWLKLGLLGLVEPARRLRWNFFSTSSTLTLLVIES